MCFLYSELVCCIPDRVRGAGAGLPVEVLRRAQVAGGGRGRPGLTPGAAARPRQQARPDRGQGGVGGVHGQLGHQVGCTPPSQIHTPPL